VEFCNCAVRGQVASHYFSSWDCISIGAQPKFSQWHHLHIHYQHMIILSLPLWSCYVKWVEKSLQTTCDLHINWHFSRGNSTTNTGVIPNLNWQTSRAWFSVLYTLNWEFSHQWLKYKLYSNLWTFYLQLILAKFWPFFRPTLVCTVICICLETIADRLGNHGLRQGIMAHIRRYLDLWTPL
jgi:hypothetical protein